MIIESLRYLYILFMNNELLKQYFPIYTNSKTVNSFSRKKGYNSRFVNSTTNKKSTNRGK